MSGWLIVGLGNPGPTYAGTRHNVGHMVIDELCARASSPLKAKHLARADVAEARLTPLGWGTPGADAARVTLMCSRGFMNESGVPVAGVARKAGVDPAHVVAIHDELDLDLGRLRTKAGGGDNGHNGLKSLRARLGTGDFYRVRVGIGRPPGRMPAADYVLRRFTGAEADDVAAAVDTAADAVESLILAGLEATQNRFNS